MNPSTIEDHIYHTLRHLLEKLFTWSHPDQQTVATHKLEFADLAAELMRLAETDLQRLAMVNFVAFRHHWAHEACVNLMSWKIMAESFAVLKLWFQLLPQLGPKFTGALQSDVFLIDAMITTCQMASIMHWPMCETSTDGNSEALPGLTQDTSASTPLPVDHHGTAGLHHNISVASSSAGDQEGAAMAAPSSPVLDDGFIARGTIASLKGTHREFIKGRRVMILDGKWADKTALFLGWSGTVCYVALEFNRCKVALGVQREVAILR